MELKMQFKVTDEQLIEIVNKYYKYKNKETKEFNKDKSIIQFISSVDNHLNYNKTSI